MRTHRSIQGAKGLESHRFIERPADSSSQTSTSSIAGTEHQCRSLIGATAIGLAGLGRKVDDQELFALAAQEKSRAVVPLSGFRVGAAAVTRSGRIITGHNLEVSDRSGSGTCAECSVAFQLRDEQLDTIVIASDSDDCIAPCGACRQTLAEVAPSDARVVMTSSSGEMRETTVGALLPTPSASLDADKLAPYQAALSAAKQSYEKADRYGTLEPHGAVLVDQQGGLHRGATRKRSGTLTRALQMAVDAHFMAGAEEAKAVIFAGAAAAGSDVPVPSGRDRQELSHLGPNVPVVLFNPETGIARLTTPEQLLPYAYRR